MARVISGSLHNVCMLRRGPGLEHTVDTAIRAEK